MPTYQYRCAKCGDQFDEWQSIHDAPLKRHRGGCGGKLDKVMSAAGIVLKGPGFYKTDNRVSATGSAKKEQDGASSDSPSSDGTSSDGTSSDGTSSDGKGSEKKSSNGKNGDSARPAAKDSGSSSSTSTPAKSASRST